MTITEITIAKTDADFAVARALGFEWVATQLDDFPDYQHIIDRVFEPVEYQQTMENLPLIHARPKGAVLLAKLDGEPVGCVMYLELEPGVAEVKRLYVKSSARGHRLGHALLHEMFARMKADHYSSARFSSAKFLTHARALYVSVGFTEIPQPDDLPVFLHDVVYFMQRRL
ncbi:MAG: GNAT family N-acetyltransferase [Rhizobiales bacterium]|nr:GNAT family N-acetyltransferase [Hyphomicrobiales bacterium]NRB13736.1 GNAT family N-acetyltransferase [Hyphomicrobiales bacterium]